MKRGKTKRMTAAVVAAVLAASIASPAAATDSVLLSLLLPGLGQAQEGHYGKATAFGGAAILSAVGLFATQVTYAREVQRYENEKRNYLYYQTLIDKGQVVNIDDVNATHKAMQTAWDDSESGSTWRDVFLGALVVTYALNLVDILISEPDTGETKQPAQTSLEWHDDSLRVVRTFRF